MKKPNNVIPINRNKKLSYKLKKFTREFMRMKFFHKVEAFVLLATWWVFVSSPLILMGALLYFAIYAGTK
jgi:hypothetical protein